MGFSTKTCFPARKELADNQQKLEDAKKELADLKVPTWTVTDRNDLPEYSDYGDNADRIRNIGKVFPVIFFLVAALISLTTMTRMVEEQRTQIGTMKALRKSSRCSQIHLLCTFGHDRRKYPGISGRRKNHSICCDHLLWDYVSQCF